MSASYSTFMELKGEIKDLVKLIKQIKSYESNDNIHIEMPVINKKDQFFSSKSEEQYLFTLNGPTIEEYVTKAKGHVFLQMDGPYGEFYSLEEVDLPQKMADAAPGAYFKISISGNSAGEYQSILAELKDKILTISIKYPASKKPKNDKWDAVNIYDPIKKQSAENPTPKTEILLGEYIKKIQKSKISNTKKIEKISAAVQKAIPYEDFLNLIKASKKSFSKDDYEVLLYNYQLCGTNYNNFKEWIGPLKIAEKQYLKLLDTILSMKYIEK